MRTQAARPHWLTLGAVFAIVSSLGALGEAARAEDRAAATPSDRAARALLLDVAFAGARVVAVGAYGHVVLSDDGGDSWRQAPGVPTRRLLTGVHFVDADRGWAVGHDGIVLHTNDGGEHWLLQHEDPAADAPLFSVWVDGEGHGLAVGAYGIAYETLDGGVQWRRRSIGGADDDFHLNEIFEAPGGSLYIAAEAGRVYRSRDRGASWEQVSTSYPGSYWGGLALSSGRLLVFGMRGHVSRSDDAGETWSEIPPVSKHSLGGGAELSGGQVVLVGLSGSLLTSVDGGERFEATIREGRQAANAVLALPDGAAIVVGGGGAARLEPPGR